MNRREFLKSSLFFSSSIAALSMLNISKTYSTEMEELDSYGMLIDVTKCIGCGSCYVACKIANNLPVENENIPRASLDLSSTRFTNVFTRKIGDKYRFVKIQCMHCIDPACVAACTVGAMRKTETGAVVVDESKCVGCRYCMVACPFKIPRFQWDKQLAIVAKCTLCLNRLEKGFQPACASVCPTNAIKFGKRKELIEEAWRRINNDEKYVKHVYGESEVGGTSILYISDVPFELLGFPKLPEYSLPSITENWFKYAVPSIITIGILLLGGAYIYNERLNKKRRVIYE